MSWKQDCFNFKILFCTCHT